MPVQQQQNLYEERGKQTKEMHISVTETSVWMLVHATVTCSTDDHKLKIGGRTYFLLPTSETYSREEACQAQR